MLEAFRDDKSSIVKYRELYKYAYILSDGIFKSVFAGEKDRSRLISLLNAMLRLEGPDAIRSLALEMQEYPGVFDKKTCILDLVGTTSAGEKVLVEIQQKGENLFRDRVEYYVARVIENQVHKSERYELPKIYFLGILDFEMFPDAPTEYIHNVDETCRGRKFFPKIQKVFVEVGKFFDLDRRGLLLDDFSPAAEWLRAFKGIIDEDPVPERILENDEFKKLFDELLLTNFENELFNVEVRNMTDLKYEHECGFLEGEQAGFSKGFEDGRVSGLKDGRAAGHAAGLEEGFEEGHAAGLEEGFEEGHTAGLEEGRAAGIEEGRAAGLEEGHAAGIEEGRAAGIEEGRTAGLEEGHAAGKLEVAKMLLALGKLSEQEISRSTGVPIEKIRMLK